jgi:Kef-type K+ transport system membrane component KefB
MLHLPTLFLQIIVVLAAARIVGHVFRKIGQPQVVGEMFAGILLGPSLFGWIAPGAYAAIFPASSLGFLNALSQFGLLLFMFLVGLDLDAGHVKDKSHATLVTSHVSICAPFVLGTALALYLYPRLSDDSVKFEHFALFMGIAMSITAFPVLARILTERRLLKTELGSVAIACAAVDDVTGWCVLAGVVLLVRASGASHGLALTVFGSLLYVAAMLFLVRPALRKLQTHYERRGNLTKDTLALVVVLVLVSGWTTEQLGIHALFGAFLMGAVMPKEPGFVRALGEKLHDAAVVLLLPLFFALTGLRTSVGLVRGSEMWFFCAIIIFVAILGKFGGGALSARASGLPWRTAASLGVLMNTRGLMELVVLNIGLDLGILSPALFTMMVLMALLTTFMTSPLLSWIYLRQYRFSAAAAAAERAIAPTGQSTPGP